MSGRREAPAFGQWQPIETCPPQRIVLLFAVTRVEDGIVKDSKMGTGFRSFAHWEWNGRTLKSYETEPTHWMPLPPAPEHTP